MRSLSRLRVRRSRLQIEALEGREVPAGVITANIAGGVLNLVGDDNSNVVTIKLEAGLTTLTPNPTTDVGLGVGIPNPIAQTATSLKATMFGGDDVIQSDGATNFALTGGVNIDLGDGLNDVVFFNTTEKIDIGSL